MTELGRPFTETSMTALERLLTNYTDLEEVIIYKLGRISYVLVLAFDIGSNAPDLFDEFVTRLKNEPKYGLLHADSLRVQAFYDLLPEFYKWQKTVLAGHAPESYFLDVLLMPFDWKNRATVLEVLPQYYSTYPDYLKALRALTPIRKIDF